MLERILVPLDGSETAEAILPQVRRVLNRHQAETLLIRAVPVFPPDFHLGLPGARAQAELYMRRVTFQLVNDGVRCRGLVRQGPAAEAILDAAAAERVSLIAMATHGQTGPARWVFGSITEKVLRASPVPVLVVRSCPSAPGKAISRGRLEELPFRNILVPLDGSEESLGVLGFVKEFAGPLDARVTLLSVVDEYAERWHSPGGTQEAAEKVLTAACIPSVVKTRRGEPAEEILKACEEDGIDLLAMATHGRSGPGRWVFGSVTEKVLHAATAPLLVVRRRRASPGGSEAASTQGISAARP